MESVIPGKLREPDGRVIHPLFTVPFPVHVVHCQATLSDAAVLAPLCDGVILVTRAGTTNLNEIRRAREQLAAVEAPIVGAVLNMLDLKKTPNYYSRYAYKRARHKAQRGVAPLARGVKIRRIVRPVDCARLAHLIRDWQFIVGIYSYSLFQIPLINPLRFRSCLL